MEQGVAAEARGDSEAAEEFLAEGEAIARQSRDRDEILTDVFANQASVRLRQGRFSDAQHVLFAALEIDQRVGNKRGESNDLNMLGLVYENLGDAETARTYLAKAFEVAYQNGLTREARHAMSNLAVQMDKAGDHDAAAGLFKQIESMGAEGGDEAGGGPRRANPGAPAPPASQSEPGH